LNNTKTTDPSHAVVVDQLTNLRPALVSARDKGVIDPVFITAVAAAIKLGIEFPKIEGMKTWKDVGGYFHGVIADGATREKLGAAAKGNNLEGLRALGTFNSVLHWVVFALDAAVASHQQAIVDEAKKAAEVKRAAELAAKKAKEDKAKADAKAKEKAEADAKKRQERLAAFGESLDALDDATFDATPKSPAASNPAPSPPTRSRVDSDGYPHFTVEGFVKRLNDAVARNFDSAKFSDDTVGAIYSAGTWIVRTLLNKRPGDYTDDEIVALMDRVVPTMIARLKDAGQEFVSADRETRLWFDNLRSQIAAQKLRDAKAPLMPESLVATTPVVMAPKVEAKPVATEPVAEAPKAEVTSEVVVEAAETDEAPKAKATDGMSLEELLWSAMIAEQTSPNDAVVLYEQARKLDPKCGLALAGMKRVKHALRMAKQAALAADSKAGQMVVTAPKPKKGKGGNDQGGGNKGRRGKSNGGRHAQQAAA